MSLIGRKPGLPPDDGIYREKGRWGNLPAGEAYIDVYKRQDEILTHSKSEGSG